MASALLFAITMCWVLATPMPSGPDETAHMIKSAAVVRGQLIGTPHPQHLSAGVTLVRVPATFESVSHRGTCTYADIETPTGCGPALQGSWKIVTMSTYEGRYPPLYYLLTGLPTLVTEQPTVVTYAMRGVGALITACLLGLAFAAMSTWGRSRLGLLGLAVAVTPTTLYLGGVVNPSGMEIAASVALWSAVTALVWWESEEAPTSLVVAAVVAACFLSASRALSTAFFAFIVVGVALTRPSGSLRLWRHRKVKVALGVSFGFAILCGIFVLVAKSYLIEAFFPSHLNAVGNILLIVGRTAHYVHQAVGAFGSPNFGVPGPVLAVWLVVSIALLAAGLLLGSRRDALVLAALIAVLGFLLPFGIMYSHVKVDGPIWQGRYSLPIIAGLPMLAAIVAEERVGTHGAARVATGRSVGAVLLFLACGWLGSWYWVLRRYTVGLGTGVVNPFKHVVGHWSPPIPLWMLVGGILVFTAAWCAWLMAEDAAMRRRGSRALASAVEMAAPPAPAAGLSSRVAMESADRDLTGNRPPG